MSNAPGRIFTEAFENLQKLEEVIVFNPSWANGTGYFDGAVNEPLQPGKIKATNDPSMRRLILIGTRFGTIVVFDRFSNQTDNGVFVTNAPNNSIIDLAVSGSSVGETEMLVLLGGWGMVKENIGTQIERGLN